MKVHVRRGWWPVLVALCFALVLGPMILVPATAQAQDSDIFEAVKSGNLAAVKSILDSMPQAANARGKNNYTPLIWAARKGYLNIVKLLLARGADINGTNKWNNTALHWAAYNGHVAVAEYLCQKGARMDVREVEKGHMPLHDAAWKCRVGVVKVLVKHGAPVNARNKFGQTPAQVALKYKCTAVANLLSQQGGGQEGGGGKTPGDAMSMDEAQAKLFAAVKARDVNTARTILAQFPKLVNARGKNNYTPLIWAARLGSMPLVTLLVSKGADVNLVNKWNNTPLHWAAYNGHTAVIIYLTRKGARTDVREIEKGHMPLHDAAWKCRPGAVSALLKAGAPATARNKFGQTPAEVAMKYKCPAVANLIQRHIQGGGGGGTAPPATDPKAALFQAVKTGNLRGAAMILAKNPELANARSKNNYTPLIWAARKGNVAMCALLLMKGADINATNKWNNTALHWAAYNGSSPVVSYLLRKGARTDVREVEKGHMPLHDAAWRGHTAVVLLLIKGGAPINARNKFGQTPLAVALKYNKMGVAQVLRQNGGTQ